MVFCNHGPAHYILWSPEPSGYPRPEFQDARFDLACVCGQQGNWDRAFEQFAMLTKGERKHARYRTEIGKIFSAMGQYDDARIQFKRALALFPEYKPARDALRELDEKSDKAVNPHAEGVRSAMRSLPLAEGYSYALDEEIRQIVETRREMVRVVGLALLLIY
ncbi:MAG: tetratricopeptide repeat protein, partial [Thermodesulfobacteriota bacterium]